MTRSPLRLRWRRLRVPVVQVAALLWWWSCCATVLVLVATGASAARGRHHCVHDEMTRLLDESVDTASRVTPQLLTEAYSPRDLAVDAFLDAAGVSHPRRLRPVSSTKTVRPIRIAFDLSKLTNDPDRVCTREGQIVKTDGGSTYRCASGDVLTPDKRDFIVTVLLKAIEDYFEAVLSVRSVVGNLIVKGLSCAPSDAWACCANAVPKTYRTEGVANADFVLHVTARPTTGATIAWALPCNLDQFGRPISGQANFGPGRLDPLTPSSRSEQIGAALHEMTHALVFSKGRFYDFRQPLNGAKWGYNNVVSQSQGAGGIYVSKIITPSVVRQVKQQFNCFDWVNAGLELENGDSGSADFSSHWEKRLLMNEYMTATSSYDPVYSALTLALFEDSGWYQVSFKNAQVLPWGYMEGCGVAQGKCSTWNSRYICSDPEQTGCTADFTSKGYCNAASYTSSIPAGFQYFQDSSFAGKDAFADYCPFYRAYINGDCRGIGRAETTFNSGNYMEEVGPTSRCFVSSLSKTSSSAAARRPTCLNVIECSSDGLRLSIGGKTVLCPLEGGDITVSGFRGTLACPRASQFCRLLRDKCSGSGVLLSDGTCECNPGFVGGDCSGIACPVTASNGQECGGSKQGKCDYDTGRCKCSGVYSGLTCSELVCPASRIRKNTSECSGHGKCDRAQGYCTCNDGYSGKSCECVPGCSSTSCGPNGSCDCTNGACSCDPGFSGVNCTVPSDPTTIELVDESIATSDTITDKEYKFYKIYLPSSTYDITFSVRYKSRSGNGLDIDLYGSFIEPFPTSQSTKSNLFVSDFSMGDRDEINLCGSLGVFPRGINDTFRRCERPTPAYLLETPGYFFLSVFGFAGGGYDLAIVTDKCKNVTCSNHGLCGVNYPGVCSCDRYWTGDDCSIPRCGPDCEDLGSCSSALLPSSIRSETLEQSSSGSFSFETPPTASAAPPTNGTLLLPPECFGHGVCRVDLDTDVPRCTCDDAFTYKNPSPAQALCKELLPSISSEQAFIEPFSFSTLDNNEALDVSAWALFSIVVKDEWEMLIVNVSIHDDETDTMLVVSKGKLPSMLLMNAQQVSYSMSSSASGSSSIEFMDLDGWISGSSSRKVALSRASSTLASGVYYVGISNGAYAQKPLDYTLTVHATSDCSSTSNDYQVCSNGGACDANASQICTCSNGFFGQFCDFESSNAMLAPSSSNALDSSTYSGSNDAGAMTPSYTNTTSSIAYHSRNVEELSIGDWAYYSFGISDPLVRAVEFRMVVLNNLTSGTLALPLLLVRGPQDTGFPTLVTRNLQDFESVSKRESVQAVSLAVDRVCTPAQSPNGCYKVAIFNRDYSTEELQFRLEVELFRSPSAALPTTIVCDSDTDMDHVCHGNGKCVMRSSTDATVDDSGSADVTTSGFSICDCRPGWMGLQCNSPTMFDAPHLWSRINGTAPLCMTCNATFALDQGELRIFRVSAGTGTGLRVRVRASSSAEPHDSVAPTVYVSEIMPRSVYDFTHISTANGSFDGDQVVELRGNPLSEFFWVVVFSDYRDVAAKDSLPDHNRRRNPSSWLQHPQRVIGDGELDTPGSPEYRVPTFTLHAETLDLTPDDSDSHVPAHRSARSPVVQWLFHTAVGLATISVSAAVIVLCVGYYVRQRCHTPRRRQNKPSDSHPTATTRDVELGRPATGAARVPRPTWRFFRSRASRSPPSACA